MPTILCSPTQAVNAIMALHPTIIRIFSFLNPDAAAPTNQISIFSNGVCVGADSVLFYRGTIRPMEPNENRPRIEMSTFVPLGVGVLSLFGICLILVASRLASPRSTVEVPDTATPFHYLFLGTEPGITTLTP